MRRYRPLAPVLAALIGLSGAAQAMDADPAGAFLPVKAAAPAPEGAAALCTAYDWVCAEGGDQAAAAGADALAVARVVNGAANAAIRPISDLRQYAVAERWALPSARGGDCEDYALFKKMKLVEAGVAPEHLLLAAVLDHDNKPHAVLVMRSEMGDFVLDNLTDRILPWNRTGYVFLRMQDPRAPEGWVSVFARGGADLSS